jgi:putative acyl-CoA dehydrogenase
VPVAHTDEGQGVTQDVPNQPPPLTGSNAWRGDPLLMQIAEGFSDPVRKDLDGLGRFVMTHEAQDLARLANSESAEAQDA